MSSSTSSSDSAFPPARTALPLAPFWAALVLAALALLGASEWLLRTQVVPADVLTGHIARFESTRATEVSFGDSHVARNFLPEAPVTNLAYPSENIAHIAWKVDRYLARVPQPKRVLLQADPHLFAAYRLREGIGDYPALFGGAYRSRPYLLSGEYRPQLGALWTAYLKTRGHLVSDIVPTAQGGLPSPGDLSRWSATEREQWTHDRVVLQTPVEHFADTADAKAFAALVHRLRAAGAEVCLVSFPLSPPYRAALAKLSPAEQARWTAALAWFRKLADQPGVRIYDDRARFDDLALFRDPDHLNARGAALYSPDLQARCFPR